MPQDVFLFSDTVANNIGFGAVEATDEEVFKQLPGRPAVDSEIDGFPEGYETMVGKGA